MDLLSVPEYVIKKGRPHGHRKVKSLETKNTIRLISRRKEARKSFSKESMIDSYEIKNSKSNDWKSSRRRPLSTMGCSKMSLNIDMKMIRPLNCDGSPILVMNSWTLLMSCNERECNANLTLGFFCKEDSSKTLVIPRTWIRNKVVFYFHWQTTRRMGQSRWIYDDQIRREQTSSFPTHESIVPRNAEKQRRWKIIFSLLWRCGYDRNCFSQNFFC